MSTVKQTIVDLFELDKMTPEKAEEMVNRLGKLVFQAVLLRALPLLSEADMTEYEKITDSNENGETIFKFLNEKVPGFENIVKEEAEVLRAELAGEFKEAEI